MNRIKQLRKDKNMTLVELGKQVGLPKGTLSRYENGSREPKEPTWQALANFFNVSVDYLKGAYSKEEIIKIVHDEYVKQRQSQNNKVFLLVVSTMNYYVIDNYLISVGAIPFDIKKEGFLVSDEQINNFNFWNQSLEYIFDDLTIKWLLEKPSLNASKEDVLKAVESAMNNIINKSSIEVLNPWLESTSDLNDHRYYSKRLEFLNSHLFYDEEVMDDGHTELIPYIDFSKTNHHN
ncbi:MAG: helix-turn-helix transcriptional regulator [Lactobacillus crispatus]|uniref:helix-turn-helix domain-containing protein n=1 Tax=Lactobacillus crispatus TaxID=47770 RepID=UPI00254B7D2F|nr:helix-turn-helix transcriptional regulator [Lactobacillus crispatus]MDK6377460.1 helix-turn-helix transcriptional regulator [Lactobacillus crispatus]MDK8509108.1 helix-turn-helix transcriptional regulator [Lactobacillus crispatus]